MIAFGTKALGAKALGNMLLPLGNTDWYSDILDVQPIIVQPSQCLQDPNVTCMSTFGCNNH